MFAPGDVVVCVKPRAPLRLSAIYRVTLAWETPWGEPAVHVREVDVIGLGYGGIHAWRFRKIDPASESFTEQMRALKPHREPVNA